MSIIIVMCAYNNNNYCVLTRNCKGMSYVSYIQKPPTVMTVEFLRSGLKTVYLKGEKPLLAAPGKTCTHTHTQTQYTHELGH